MIRGQPGPSRKAVVRLAAELEDEELERIAKAVLDKLLDAPQGVEIVLRASGAKPFHALLPGVPRAGEVVWHRPRSNSAPRPFIVRRVEWWNVWPHVQADVFIEALPQESDLSREVRALPQQRVG